MRRPAPEVLWTVALVVVLLGAAVGVGTIALTRAERVTAPSQPGPSPTSSSPAATAVEPTPPQPEEPGSRSPAPPTATATRCPQVTERLPLRVMTLNVHGGRGPAGFDLDRLAALIRGAGVDVALLQEVDRFRGRSRHTDMPRVLAARTGMAVAYGLNTTDLPGRAVSGTATLSRFPIVSEHNLRLPTAPGRKPRGLLRTDLDVDGVRVSLLNTHLENAVPRLRLRQAAVVREIVAAVRHPVVLGGDLNAVPTSPAAVAAQSVLADSWADAGLGPGYTAPAGRPRRRIDQLFHSPGVRVGSIEVLAPVVSDHRAVRARYVLTVAGDQVCVPELDRPVGGGGRDGGGGGDR